MTSLKQPARSSPQALCGTLSPDVPAVGVVGRDRPWDKPNSDRYGPKNQVLPLPALCRELVLPLSLVEFGKIGEKLTMQASDIITENNKAGKSMGEVTCMQIAASTFSHELLHHSAVITVLNRSLPII